MFRHSYIPQPLYEALPFLYFLLSTYFVHPEQNVYVQLFGWWLGFFCMVVCHARIRHRLFEPISMEGMS